MSIVLYHPFLYAFLAMSRILIAEDNVNLLRMNKLAMKKAGFEVASAKNGKEAIAIMDRKKIDVCLLDLLMPKVNGFGVMAHARKRKYRFPIVVLTNLDGEMDRKTCKKLGAADVLVKSETDLPAIIEKVRTVV